MTEAAVKMQSTNTPIVQSSVSYPLSASEAYRLGVNIHTAILNMYASLAEKCSTENDRHAVDKVVKQDQVKIAALEKEFKFALSSEVGRFYAAGGTLLETDEMARQISDTSQLIQRNIDNCSSHVRSMAKEADATKDGREIITVASQINGYIKDMYLRLAQLYPQGEIRQAFQHMADLG
jgi:hypothetical protein